MKIKRFKSILVLSAVSTLSLLAIQAGTAKAAAASCVWVQGSSPLNNLASDPANWSCSGGAGTKPADGDQVTFQGGGMLSGDINLDYAVNYGALIFSGDPNAGGNSCSRSSYRFSGSYAMKVQNTGAANTGIVDLNYNTSAGCSPKVLFVSGFKAIGNVDFRDFNGELDMQVGDPAQTAMPTLDLSGGSVQFTSATNPMPAKNTFTLANPVIGNGNIIVNGESLVLAADNPSFSGPIDVGGTTGGTLQVNSFNSLGTGTVSVNDNGTLAFGSAFQGKTLGNALTLNGQGATIQAQLSDADTLILSGAITLSQDAILNPNDGIIKVTGAISDGHNNTISLANGQHGAIVLDASSNNSGTANGILAPTPFTTMLTDNTSDAITVNYNEALTVDGTRGDTVVRDHGTLQGHGTVGTLTVLSGGHVAPGNSPGCLKAGNTTFSAGSFLDIQIAGNTVCSEYDQLNVNGTIDLGNATLTTALLNGFIPKAGDVFTVVSASGALTGTFNGIAEGDQITVSGVTFKVSYSNNKVTLTVSGVDAAAAAAAAAAAKPGTPNTGLALLAANPVFTLIGTSASAGSLFALSRKYKLSR